MKEQRYFNWGIDVIIFMCLLKIVFIGKMNFEAVGFLIGLGLIWTPHAYFRKKETENYYSISYNKKKIESLTTSLNLLSVKLREVEKLSQQTAKTQGFSNLNRKFTL